MRMAIRFIFPLLLVLAGIAWVGAPLVGGLVERWFRTDVESRSQLIFSSIEDSVVSLALAKADGKIDALFRNISLDERVLALGLCTPDGRLAHRSQAWPKALTCPGAPAQGRSFTVQQLDNGPVLVATFALTADASYLGRLVILHDLRFIESRSDKAELYLALFLGLLGLGAAVVTVAVARLTLRGWISAVRKGITAKDGGKGSGFAAVEVAPLIDDMRKMLRDLVRTSALSEGIRVDWSPDSLRAILRTELPDAEVMVVSNREPYIHNHEDDGKVAVQRPASGLVTALEPIMRACGGTWIAHGSGSADKEMVDSDDHIAVPPDATAYTLRRLWLTDEEQDGYYYGFANEGMWPLCHIAFVRPLFRASDWEQYVAVNQKFADAVVAEARTGDPVVLVQDYHFALLPRMVRERLPNATIITFWHIPWPNPEVFSICPWKEEILSGLLGSSILGFHTQFHCINFQDSVDRFLESHIDREHSTIRAGEGTTLVRPYPISIEWPPAALENQPPIAECRAAVFERYGIAPEVKLSVGVERFDYTKGIADRFRAVESMLENHPEWIGRFTLLQVAAPTRSRLSVYRETQVEAEAIAASINARFGRDGWKPVILVSKHHEPDAVFTLFRAADVCLVSSLHDGMNLVAKEFVASRDDDDGVLVLSTFAGASRELQEALIVNPYDVQAMGEAIHSGLAMPAAQRSERMRFMRDLVGENNIYYWAGRMLLDAARMRKRNNIEKRIVAVARARIAVGAE